MSNENEIAVGGKPGFRFEGDQQRQLLLSLASQRALPDPVFSTAWQVVCSDPQTRSSQSQEYAQLIAALAKEQISVPTFLADWNRVKTATSTVLPEASEVTEEPVGREAPASSALKEYGVARSFPAHPRGVLACTFSPAGVWLASAAGDGGVTLRDFESGAVLHHWSVEKGYAWSLAFSPDGKWLASAGSDRTLRVWDALTGTPVCEHPIPGSGSLLALAFSPRDRQIAVGGYGGQITVLETHSFDVVRTIATGHRVVNCIQYSRDGAFRISAGADKLIKVWDCSANKFVRTLESHAASVIALSLSQRNRLVSGGRDGLVNVWDTDTWTRERILEGQRHSVIALDFHPTGGLLASGSADGTIMIWNIDSRDLVDVVETEHKCVNSVAFHRAGGLVSGGADGCLHAWAPMAKRKIKRSAPVAPPAVAKRCRLAGAPRVDIAYDVEVGGAIEKREIPFVVGVLADLSGQPEPSLSSLRVRKFVEVDRDNFDHVVGRMAPRLAFEVDDRLNGGNAKLAVELRFRSLEDFEPEKVANQIPVLRQLIETRKRLANVLSNLWTNDHLEDLLQSVVHDPNVSVGLAVDRGSQHSSERGQSGGQGANAPELLDYLVDASRPGTTHESREASARWFATFVNEVIADRLAPSRDTGTAIALRIATLDDTVSRQLREIMHAGLFRELEASWRGLHYLVARTETSPSLKIKALNVSKRELARDLRHAVESEQSALFAKVHEEFWTLGGQPFGALIGDYEISRHPQDIELLSRMSNIAAAAHAPFLAAASPELLQLEKFTQLSGPRDLAKIFDSEAYLQWRTFRKTKDSKYVGLCLPHILMRLPYGKDTVPVEGFDYEEGVDGQDHSKYLWGNAAYALAARLTDAFNQHEWCAAIRGVEGGGLVEGLPVHTFQTDDGEWASKCPTEIAITDRRDNELAGLGFIPLCFYKNTANAAFMAAQSVNQPTKCLDANANANARLSSQLQYMFAVSRFAHFLKAMMRDKIGSFMSREQCEKFLNEWISHYILLDDHVPDEVKARFPLRRAGIKVAEVPGKPGAYVASVFVEPHFQLDRAAPVKLAISLSNPLS